MIYMTYVVGKLTWSLSIRCSILEYVFGDKYLMLLPLLLVLRLSRDACSLVSISKFFKFKSTIKIHRHVFACVRNYKFWWENRLISYIPIWRILKFTHFYASSLIVCFWEKCILVFFVDVIFLESCILLWHDVWSIFSSFWL